MAKVLLSIREVDKDIFELIKRGKKTIEIRAATVKFNNIQPGDTLIFRCGKDELEKKVIEIHTFLSINKLLEVLDFKIIMPFAKSKEEIKKILYSFPNYQEKIHQYGLVAFILK